MELADDWVMTFRAHGRALPSLVAGVSLLGALALLADASHSEELQHLPSCVRSWPEARFRSYGYLHIVHLANDCRIAAHCDVSTDNNPKPVNVVVPANQRVEVVAARGSTVRQFVPRVSCELAVSAQRATTDAALP